MQSSEDRSERKVLVSAFYEFAALDNFEQMRAPLLQSCQDLGLMGTILLAAEGINGTVAGPQRSVLRLMQRLQSDPRLAAMQYKTSWADEVPFYRMKVRLKKEIVTLGVPGVDPAKAVGEYVPPEQWNSLVSRPEVRLVDTRNDYEVHLGTFRNAENPETASFRDFPRWVEENLDPEKDEHVAMFCTGGIRCEKSTAYLLKKGFRNVYHLEGGILNYLEKVAPEDSFWEGDCFVFDNRVTVDHHLNPGDFEVCPACRMPVTPEDRESPLFELHVSCPKCFDRLTPEKREGLLERARQIELAAERGEKHIGSR
jgi:UPF0176 protein